MPQQKLHLDGKTRPLTRRANRLPAASQIIVLSNTGEQAVAKLHDVSTYGCNLIGSAKWLRCGAIVVIELTPEKAVPAIVRWVRGGSCGAEFLRPISFADAEAHASD